MRVEFLCRGYKCARLIVILTVTAGALGQGIPLDKNDYTPITFHVTTVNTLDARDGQQILVSGGADIDGHSTSYQLSCWQHLAHAGHPNTLVCKHLRAGDDYPAKLYEQYGASIDFWQGAVPPKGKRIFYEQYNIDSEN